MSDRERDGFRNGEDLERALLGLPPAEPDEGFRERLREAFVSGSIRPADRPRRRRLRALLAAAAVLLAATLGGLLLLGDGDGYEVFDVAGTGAVVLDGRAVPLDDRDEIAARLAPGVEVRVPPTATLDLRVSDRGLLELTGGTRMVLPGIREGIRGRVEAGELRFASGPGFGARAMVLTTPEGIVTVTGTLLSVQRDERGTCVCVLEGEVSVGRDEGDLETIPAGERKVMPAGGGTKITPIAPPHRDGLRDFATRTRDRFPRR